MPLDFNDAPEQREFGAIIPDGTFVKLSGKIRAGGASLPDLDPVDGGLLKQSATSNAVMIDWEFTVLFGPHAKQKLWQLMTISGGSLDEKGQSKAGNISKGTIRAMLDSAIGLNPRDISNAARAHRVIRGFSDLDGIEFAARLGIEKGGARSDGDNYPDKNRIAHVVVPGEPEWQPVMRGQDVAPKPTGVTQARGAGGQPQQDQWPQWQRDAAPAQTAQPTQYATPATPQPQAAVPTDPQPAWHAAYGPVDQQAPQPVAAQPTPASAQQQPAGPGPAWMRE